MLLSPAPLRTVAQGLVQLEAVARCPVGVVPLPVGAARLQEEVSPRSEGPVGSVQLTAAIERLFHTPPDAALAPASTSQRALGVGDASPVASSILLVSRAFRAPLSSLCLFLLHQVVRHFVDFLSHPCAMKERFLPTPLGTLPWHRFHFSASAGCWGSLASSLSLESSSFSEHFGLRCPLPASSPMPSGSFLSWSLVARFVVGFPFPLLCY